MEAPAASYSVQLGDRGRMVLPAPLRKKLKLRPGDDLIVTLQRDGSLRLATAATVVRESRGMYSALAPGRSLSDELIAERRAESRRESSRR